MASLKSYALTTLARLKTYLDITTADDDTLLTDIINATTEWVENYCNRRFKQTAYSNEEIDSDGSNFLFLKHYPINTSKTFTLQERDTAENSDDWSTIDAEDYFIEEEGFVRAIARQTWNVGIRRFRANYTAGYNFDNSSTFLSDTEAGDLELAIWKLCGSLYNERRGDARVRSEKIGSYSVTFMKIAFEDDPTIGTILDNYKKRDEEISGGVSPYMY